MSLNQSKTTLRKCYHDSELLARALDKVCIQLDDKYDINNGGCCYIAYLVCKLLKQDGFNPKLMIYDFELDDNINSINDLYFAHNHYCIKLGNVTINESDFDDLESVELDKIQPIDILKHYQDETWNNEYRTSNNAKVAQILRNKYFGIKSNIRKRRSKNKGK